MYLTTLRPMAHDIAIALKVPEDAMKPGTPAHEIGAAYLKAFFEDLYARLEQHD